jgi:hypothetical protein
LSINGYPTQTRLAALGFIEPLFYRTITINAIQTRWIDVRKPIVEHIYIAIPGLRIRIQLDLLPLIVKRRPVCARVSYVE